MIANKMVNLVKTFQLSSMFEEDKIVAANTELRMYMTSSLLLD